MGLGLGILAWRVLEAACPLSSHDCRGCQLLLPCATAEPASRGKYSCRRAQNACQPAAPCRPTKNWCGWALCSTLPAAGRPSKQLGQQRRPAGRQPSSRCAIGAALRLCSATWCRCRGGLSCWLLRSLRPPLHLAALPSVLTLLVPTNSHPAGQAGGRGAGVDGRPSGTPGQHARQCLGGRLSHPDCGRHVGSARRCCRSGSGAACAGCTAAGRHGRGGLR